MVRYTEEQKAAALKLADKIGAKKASDQLSISYPTILNWRKTKEEASVIAEEPPPVKLKVADSPKLPLELQVQLLQQENAQLKVQLARQSQAIHALSPIVD